mgnify:CR=1 FL=1
MKVLVGITLATTYEPLMASLRAPTPFDTNFYVQQLSHDLILAAQQTLLPGYPPEYPPVNFTFATMRHLVSQSYDWVVRCDADTFVNYTQLESFLQTKMSATPVFIGHRVHGRRHERRFLNISHYAEGGACDILNRAAANVFQRHVTSCFSDSLRVRSPLRHSDVEISRCLISNGVKLTPHDWRRILMVRPKKRKHVTLCDLHAALGHLAPMIVHPIKTRAARELLASNILNSSQRGTC